MNAADTPEKEPTVLPHVFYEKVRPGLRPRQRIKTEISAIQVDNDDEHDLRWTGNVELHDEIKTGRVVTDLRAEAIAVYSIQKSPPARRLRPMIGPMTPQISAGWRMPLALTSLQRSTVLEPRMQLVYVGGPDMTDDIPNRDSADYRIDEGNLFLLNRYQGYDYLRPDRAPILECPPSLRMRWSVVSGFVGAAIA